MSRQPRLQSPGSLYCVTLRGNHRQPIFGRHADRQTLRMAKRLVERFAASHDYRPQLRPIADVTADPADACATPERFPDAVIATASGGYPGAVR